MGKRAPQVFIRKVLMWRKGLARKVLIKKVLIRKVLTRKVLKVLN